ncbi:hypothetical protein EDD86DRAFT_213162 [Gorgonomyces haynaldii]|nr:hypothetical protein EDD86DRAFT_213162 [Gorgonomyces haynaldii]
MSKCLFPFVWVITFALLVYKGYVFPFVGPAFGLEMFCLFPWVLMEIARLYSGSRGNKTEQLQPVLLFLGTSVVGLVAHLYYGILQSYVLMLDVILHALSVIVLISQLVNGTLLAVTLSKNK